MPVQPLLVCMRILEVVEKPIAYPTLLPCARSTCNEENLKEKAFFAVHDWTDRFEHLPLKSCDPW